MAHRVRRYTALCPMHCGLDAGSETMRGKESRKLRRSAKVVDALVLSAITDSSKPLTVYAVAQSSSNLGQPLVPVQVYRSVARLLKRGEIERIASSSAFVRAQIKHSIHLLCADCGSCETVAAKQAHQVVTKLCLEKDFDARERHLEVSGHCGRCNVDS